MDLNSPNIKKLIVVLSIVVPILVAILYLLPKNFTVGEEVYFLPMLNAFLNGTTSILLVAGFIAIKNGKKKTHKRIMFTALVLSILFLLSYVTYHALTESTPFGGEGMIKVIYLVILLTHIVLAIAIVPLVLISFSRAFSAKFDKHKKIARITLPLWLYVTVTGVIVYLMISPYY
ncbi:MAG: putative membrane protein [Vicingaceae bacterium]|jgi:putative membrane protein